MFSNEYGDDIAEDSDIPEEQPYHSDFESMLSANNSIDDQLRVSSTKDFVDRPGYDSQDYGDDFYDESYQGSSVGKGGMQEFSSITFAKSKPSPIPEEPKRKKHIMRKKTPKAAKVKESGDVGQRSIEESRTTPRESPRSSVSNNRPRSNNNNNNNNIVTDNIYHNDDIENKYHKYKRIEVHTPQITEANTRSVIPITSHVVKGMKHNSFSTQRQLDLCLKKIESYKHENSILRAKLDASGIESAVERYKVALLEKEIKISQLTEENHSLKMVARHQSKCLVQNDREKQQLPERELSQDRQIEILMEHIRKLKTKIADYKCMEQQFVEETNAAKAHRDKQNRRILKLKKQITELTTTTSPTSYRESLGIVVVKNNNNDDNKTNTKEDLLDLINQDISKAGSSQTRNPLGRKNSTGNDTVTTYPSIALTEESKQLDHNSSLFTSHIEPSTSLVVDDDVSIPLEDDEVSEMTTQKAGSMPGTANAISGGAAGGRGPRHSRNHLIDHSRVDSESTFSIETNTTNNNPTRRIKNRREFTQRIQELMLQVEEEKLYVLRQKELILKLEKSSTKQRHGYILEINTLKAELTKCEEERKSVVNELNKRELKLKMQTLTLKQLRTAYEELLEGHKQLLNTKETLEKAGMTNPIPTLKNLMIKAHPPVTAILEPRPPSMQRPSSTGNLRPTGVAKSSLFANEDDVGDDFDLQAGGNVTFMTSDMDEQL